MSTRLGIEVTGPAPEGLGRHGSVESTAPQRPTHEPCEEWYLTSGYRDESAKASRSEVIARSLLDRKTQPLFAAPREVSFLHVSPDGKHIVYVSDETGTPEIYVRSLPGPGGAVRVSAAGGTSPVWRSDGKALFYVAPNAETIEVDVRPGEGLVLSSPRVAVRAIPGYEQLWGMSPNGDRFLRFASDAFGGFTLMLGWSSRLEREGAEQ